MAETKDKPATVDKKPYLCLFGAGYCNHKPCEPSMKPLDFNSAKGMGGKSKH